jgi:deazaflavin-dependent oxidoreductase (nitroreductase family)
MPRLLPQITGLDTWVQSVSGGWLSLLTIAGLPNLLLIVPGRSTGIDRSTPLLCVPQGSGWLIAGSAFGGPQTPAWVRNLRAAERARVVFHGQQETVAAEELSGDDRVEAWAVMSRVWPNYALYEQRTSRLIPVFRLTPFDTSVGGQSR